MSGATDLRAYLTLLLELLEQESAFRPRGFRVFRV